MLVDPQCKAVDNHSLVGVHMITSSGEERVKKSEWWYRLIKERSRTYHTMLPFDDQPRIMIAYLMIIVLFYINSSVWEK